MTQNGPAGVPAGPFCVVADVDVVRRTAQEVRRAGPTSMKAGIVALYATKVTFIAPVDQ